MEDFTNLLFFLPQMKNFNSFFLENISKKIHFVPQNPQKNLLLRMYHIIIENNIRITGGYIYENN